MSTLKEEIHKNNFLMDKGNKKLYFVIKIDSLNVWLRLEDEDKGDDCDCFKVPKQLINLTYVKVNPDVMKVLYGSKDGIIKSDAIPDMPDNQGK